MFRLDIKIINLVHVFVVGAILMYIGMNGNNTPKETYYVLFSLVLLIFFIVPPPKMRGFSYWNIIHLTHYLIIVPGLLYIAYFGLHKKLTSNVYTILTYLGGGICLYHGYKFATRVL